MRTRGFILKHSYRAASCSFVSPSLTHQVLHSLHPPLSSTVVSRPQVISTVRLYSSLVNDTDSYTSWQEEEEEEEEASIEHENYASEGDDDEGNDALMEEYSLWIKAVQKALKALEKKQNSLQSEWKKAQTVEETMARAQLLVSNLYLFPSPTVREATVQDWENDGKKVLLKVDEQYESASAEADALFDKARKLKRGSTVIQDLLGETERALTILQEALLDLESAREDSSTIQEGRLRLVQDRLERTAKLTKFVSPQQLSLKQSASRHKQQQQQQRPASPYTNIRKLKSPGGCDVLVGRNRRGNEYLSFQVARGKDIWMHSRGCPGAHVLIQWRRGSPEPTDACWQFAANLAIFYSDNRTEQKAQVTAAEAKHLLKPRGAPMGALKLREELRVLVGRPDDVPEDLKLARDESGQSDEYRSSDKAKHRRHTQKVAKETQAKRRAQQKAKRKRRNRDS